MVAYGFEGSIETVYHEVALCTVPENNTKTSQLLVKLKPNWRRRAEAYNWKPQPSLYHPILETEFDVFSARIYGTLPRY